MSTNGAGNTAHTNNGATRAETNRVRSAGGTSPATKLLAVLSSFAMLVGIGLVGLFTSTVAAPEAQAAALAGGQPLTQGVVPKWQPLLYYNAVWLNGGLRQDATYWATDNSPASNGNATTIINMQYNWSADSTTFQAAPVLQVQRLSTAKTFAGFTAPGSPVGSANTSLSLENWGTMASAKVGGNKDNPEGPLSLYTWDNGGAASQGGLYCNNSAAGYPSNGYTPILRFTSGSPDIYWACMPIADRNSTPRLGDGDAWGGEADQYTGNIYVSGALGGALDSYGPGSSATNQRAANTYYYALFTVWNPQTGMYTLSNIIQPGDWYQGIPSIPQERSAVQRNVNGTTGSSAEVSADFVLDADGNIYVYVGNTVNNTSAGAWNAKIVRIEPTRDAQGNITQGTTANPWRYYVVSSVWKDPSVPTMGWNDAGSIWGNAFINGKMLLTANLSMSNYGTLVGAATSPALSTGTTRLVEIDPLTNLARPAYSTDSSSGGALSTGGTHDSASPQGAQVVSGHLYNDVDGDGVLPQDDNGNISAPGVYNASVGLYDSTGKLLAIHQTDSSGRYDFIVSGNENSVYYVRPVQVQIPQADGTTMVNAAQTWALGSQETGINSLGQSVTNDVSVQCYNVDGQQVTDDGTGTGQACYGALNPSSADPALGAVGSTSDPATWMTYARMDLHTANQVPTADFGFTTYGSYGDAGAGPVAANVPAHINTDPANQVWFGSVQGQYAGAATATTANTNPHSTSDDGVFISTYDGLIPLQDTTLAATGSYSLVANLSGNAASNATAAGWTTGISTGTNANTWNNTATWNPTVSGSAGSYQATGTFQYQQNGNVSGSPTVQLRTQVSPASITQPTNVSGQYYSTNATTGGANWTTPGEIEDYSFKVADSVYRPAVKSTSGSATVTVNGQSLTANSAAFTFGTAVTATANQPASFTAVMPDSSWQVQSATVVNTKDGTPAATPTVTTSGNTSTISWTTTMGADVRVELLVGKAPDPNTSTLTLDKPSTPAGTDITATVAAKDAAGNLLGNQKVFFTNATPSATTIDATTCTTDGVESSPTFGTCSVHITSDIAGTYTDELTAKIGEGSNQITAKNSPATVTFTALKGAPDKSSMSIDKGGPLVVGTDAANTYTVMGTVKDSLGNAVTGQEVRFSVTNLDGSAVTSNTTLNPAYCNTTGTNGSCSVALTSTKSGDFMITASIEDPDNPGSWVPVSNAPMQRTYGPGPVSVTNSSVQVTDNNHLNNGTDTDEITATAKDQYGNAVVATIQIRTTDTTLSLANGGVITTDSTTGTGTLYATSLIAGDHTATATIGSDAVPGSPLTLSFTAIAAQPDHSTWVLTANGTEVTAPVEVGTVVTATATTKDVNNNPVGGVKVDFANEGPTYAAYTNGVATCTTNNDRSDPAFGTCSVTFTDEKPETVTSHARMGGQDIVDSPKTVTFQATIVDPGHSKIETNTSSVPANGTDFATITVTLLDKYDNVVKNSSNTVVISSNRSSDIVDLTLNKGDGTYTTTIKSNTSGDATLGYTINGMTATGDSSTVTVNFSATAISPVESSWTVTPTSSAGAGANPVANGNASTDYWTAVLTARDASGNALTGLDTGTIRFSASLPTVNISAVQNTGNGTYTVKYTTTKSGDPTASVTVANSPIGSNRGSTAEASLPIPFQAGPLCVPTPTTPCDPTNYTHAWVQPNNATANGTDTDTINAVAYDANGNAVAGTFTLTSYDARVTLAGTTLTIDPANGVVTATTTATSTTPGTYPVMVTVLQNGNQVVLQESPLQVSFTAGEVSAQTSTLVVSPTTQQVGQTVTATVTAKDATGTVLANKSIIVAVDGQATATYNGTTAKTIECVTGATGTCQLTITDTKAESVNVTATVGGANIVDSPTPVLFTPGPFVLSSSTIGANPTTGVPNNGTDYSTITVTLYDQYGNVVTAPNIVEMTPTLGTIGNVTQNTDGTYSARLTSTQDGTSVVSYRVNAQTGPGTASVVFIDTTVPVFSTVNSTWTVRPTTSAPSGTQPMANGNASTDYYTAIITAKDQRNTLLPGLSTLDFALSVDPSIGVRIYDVQDMGDGTYTAKITSTKAYTDPTTAQPMASLTYKGTPVNPTSLAVPFQAGPVCVTNCQVNTTTWVSPNSAVANGTDTDTINVQAYDAYGNPAAGTFTLTSLDGTIVLNRTTISTDAVTGLGSTTATSTTAGNYRVQVTYGSTQVSNSPAIANFIPGAVDRTQSTLTVDRTTQTVGLNATATVTAKDATGNTMEGVSIQVSVDQYATLVGTPQPQTYGCITNGSGVCTVQLTDQKADLVTVTATVNEAGTATPITGSPKTVQFTAETIADATQSSIGANPQSIVADQTTTSTITVILRDRYGNQLATGAGNTVTMTPTLGTLSSVTNNGDGTFTATLKSASNDPGTSQIAYTVNSNPGNGTAVVDFTQGPRPEFSSLYSTWTVTPTSTAASGSPVAGKAGNYWTAVLTARNGDNQPMTDLTLGAINFTADPNSGVTISSVTNTGNGTYTVQYTSTVAGSMTAKLAYNGTAVSPDKTIQFQADVACNPNVQTCNQPPEKQTRAVVDPDNALANGTATDGIVVYAYDANGNPAAATFTLVPDSNVSLAATSLTVTQDNSTTSTTATSTVVGNHMVSVDVDGGHLTTLQPNFVPSTVSATNSTLAVDRTSQVVGQNVMATVTAKDDEGHLLDGVDVTVKVTNSATLGSEKVQSYTCTTVTDPLGTCQVALTDSVAETVSVTAQLGIQPITGSPKSVEFTVGPASATGSTITAQSPRNANGSDASVVTVTVKDEYGNNLGVGGANVTMSSTLGTLTNVTDKHDGTYTANLTSVNPGTATVSFAIGGTTSPNTASVLFTASPFDPAASNWTVTPMSASSTPVANGTDYWTGTLYAKDASGAALVNVDTQTIKFTTNHPDDVMISDVVNHNDGTYTVQFTSLKSGDSIANVSVNNGDPVKNVNQTITFQAGTACIVTPTEPCSGEESTTTRAWVQPDDALSDGTATDTIHVEAFDKNGNPTTGTFTLTAKDGQIIIAATRIETTQAQPERTTTATSHVASGHPVGVQLNGVDLPDVTVHYMTTAVDPGMSTLTVDRTTQAAGGPVVATVTAKDSGGYTLDGVTIQVAVNNSATLGTDKVKLYDCHTETDGTCTVTLTDEKAETVSVTASVNTGPISGSPKSVTFTAAAADPTKSTIEAAPTDRLANGAQSSVVTVTLKDTYGNTLTTGGDTVTMTTSLGSLTTVADKANGTYTANLSSTAPGTATVSYTVNAAQGTGTASVVFSESPFCANNSSWTVAPTTSAATGAPVANGNADTDYWTGTLTAKDCYGVQLTGLNPALVHFTASTGVTVSAVTQNTDGTYSAKFTSTTAGNQVANVTYNGSDQVAQVNQGIPFQAGTICIPTDTNPCAGGDNVTKAWVSNNDALANGQATDEISVQAYDENGNPVAARFTLTGDGQVTLAATTINVVAGNGTGKTTGTSTVPGEHVVTVSVDGTPLPDLSLNYVQTAVSTTNSTLTVNRTTQEAGQPVTATVTAKDDGGLLLANITVVITVDKNATIGTDKAKTFDCKTNGDGVCSVDLTDETAEQVSVTARVNDGPISGSPKSVTFQSTIVDPDQSTISANPTSRTANGSEASVVTVTLKDQYGNQLDTGGATVVMTATNGARLSNVRDNGDGTYTANLTSTTPGTSVVTYTVNGADGAGQASVEFVAGEFCAANSTWSIAPTTSADSGNPIANGDASTDYWTGTLSAADCFGVQLKSLDTTQIRFTSDSDSVVVSPVTQNADGTYSAKFTSTVAQSAKASVTYGGSAKVGPVQDQNIAFQGGAICIPDDTVNPPVVCSGDLDTTTRAWVDPNGALADNSTPNVIHVQAFDEKGNPIDATFTLATESTVNLASSTVNVTAVGGGKATTNATSFAVGHHVLHVSVQDPTPLPDLDLIYTITETSERMSTLTVDTPVQTAGTPITITVTAKDKDGNVQEGIPIQISVNNSGQLGDDLAASYECVTVADGTCTVPLNDTVAEPVTITATANVGGEAKDINGSPMTVNFVVGPPDPTQSTIQADQLNRVNDGVQTSVVTVTLKDHFGNQLKVGGDTITMAKTLGTLSTVKDNNDGTYTASLTSVLAGDSTVTYTVDGTAGTGNVVVHFIDTTAPDSPTVTSPKPGAQLNDPTPEVTGKAEPNSDITVKDKTSNEILCTTKADENGNYSCTVSDDTALGDGPHTISVYAADPSGNTSDPTDVTVTIDTVPPVQPEIDKANGTEISGRADPNTIITVTVDGVAEPQYTTSDELGNWTILTPAGTTDGGTVSVTSTDAAGNESTPDEATIDITAPDKPEILVANSTEISGTAEPGSTVTIRIPGITDPVEVKADEDGNWSYKTPEGATDAGQAQVTATATDEAGNRSQQATHDFDITPPAKPEIDVANGTEISGTADPGSMITVTIPAKGDEPDITLKTGPVGEDGTWTVTTPADTLDEGTIHVVATDPAGNDSTPAETTIDITAPEAPKVDVANATEVSGGPGAAEPGSTVTVEFPGGMKSATTANEDGSYIITTPPNTPEGDIHVTATDHAGNVSDPTIEHIDTVPPNEPTIETANGTEISGTADPGTEVTITVPGVPDPIKVGPVGEDGKWTIDTPEGTTDKGDVVVKATDPAGNDSPEVKLPIDITPPNEPTIDVANGTEISGTADPGTEVTIIVPGVPEPIKVGPVGDDGKWTIDTPEGTTDGEDVVVKATDPAGNDSPEVRLPIDITPPATPEIDVANGTEISGTADPGTEVTITVPGQPGEPDITVRVPVGDDGKWTTPTPEGATDGTVYVHATDPAGNDSPEVSMPFDITPPKEPTIDKANGTEISGTADPGSTVTITVPGQPGEPDITRTVPVGDDGKWTTPTPEGATDGKVHVYSTDPAGNDSPTLERDLDVTAPEPPVVEATPTQIYGTAEPGSTLEITVPGVDQPIKIPVPDDGHWSHEVPAGAHNGTVSVTATDQAGNTSEPGYAELDQVGPAVDMPIINHANATHVAGDNGSTKIPGATITVTFPDGQVKTTVADENGAWSIDTPAKADGSKMQSGTVRATATDPTTHVVSEPRSHELDTDAPAQPKVDVANATEIAGNPGAAEPGATVTVTWPDGTTTPAVVHPDGSYTVPTQPDLPNDSVIKVTVTDPAGNVSAPPVEVTVDTKAPDKPTIETANGTEISGKAEPGSTVTIVVPGVDDPITAPVGDDGKWTVTTPDGATNGTVHVTATDPAGNTSPEATHYIDVEPPNTPSVDVANGTEVSGTADKGTTVTVKFPDGTVKTTTSDPDTGKYTVTTPAGMPDGGTITVTSTDDAGNVSDPITVKLDTTPPNDPTIDRADATKITGTSDPGSTVIITVPGENGDITIETTVGDDGKFDVDTPAGAKDGTVHVVAKDPAGNVSGEVSRTIKVSGPTKLIVNDTNGSQVTGSSDAGAVITITDGNGQPVGCKNADGTVSPSATVDNQGNFSCIPDKVLTPGSTIKVVVTDASGKTIEVTKTIKNVSIDIAYPERHHLDLQTVTGHVFNPGEQVCLVVYSEPLEVGCDAADQSGDVTFTFPVPDTLDYGDHTATLTGQSSQLSASISFAVVQNPEIRTAGTSQPNSEALLWSVMLTMIAGSAVAAMGIRRLKVTK